MYFFIYLLNIFYYFIYLFVYSFIYLLIYLFINHHQLSLILLLLLLSLLLLLLFHSILLCARSQFVQHKTKQFSLLHLKFTKLLNQLVLSTCRHLTFNIVNHTNLFSVPVFTVTRLTTNENITVK